MKKQFLEVGKIVSTKGLKGETVIECWCDSPEFLCSFEKLYVEQGKQELVVLKSRVHKSTAVLLFQGIDSIEKADLYRGKVLYINRDDVQLENGRYFIQDLLGLEVFDVDTNKKYGIITEVFKTGANDVYQISDDKQNNYLIPVIHEVVIDIDIKNSKIFIRPLRGIFDEI